MKGIIDVLKSVWQKLMGNEFTRWLVYIGIVAFCFCIVYNAGKYWAVGLPYNDFCRKYKRGLLSVWWQAPFLKYLLVLCPVYVLHISAFGKFCMHSQCSTCSLRSLRLTIG